MLIVPDNRRWRERPNYPRPLNRGHYAVDNLLAAHAFTIDQNRSLELAFGRPANIVGNNRAFGGSGFYFTAANNNSISGISQTITSTRQAYTLEVIGIFNSITVTSSVTPYLFDCESGRLVVGTTYSGKAIFGVYDGTWRYTASYTPFAGTNVYRHLAITLFDGGNHKVYDNGILQDVLTAGMASNLGGNSQFFYRYAPQQGLYNPANCYFQYAALHNGCFSADQAKDRYENPWAIFVPRRDVLYFFPVGGATTYTSSAALDSFIQRSGITKYTSLDALLKSIKSTSVGFDSLLSALKNKSLTIDGLVYLLQTKTVSLDSLVRMAKSQSLSVDALVYSVLSQHATLDALLKSSGISKTSSLDSLIQASKASTLSLDAIVLGAGSGMASTALDGLILAVKTKTLSLDAMLRSSHVSIAQLDALLSAFKTKTLSLDAIVSGIPTRSLTLDALLKIGRSVSVSLDAIVAAALASAVSFDAVLFLAGSLSMQVDAYLQKEKARYTRLDAFIGAFIGAWMSDGRALFISGGDRFVRQQMGDRLVLVPGNSRDININ